MRQAVVVSLALLTVGGHGLSSGQVIPLLTQLSLGEHEFIVIANDKDDKNGYIKRAMSTPDWRKSNNIPGSGTFGTFGASGEFGSCGSFGRSGRLGRASEDGSASPSFRRTGRGAARSPLFRWPRHGH